MNIEEPVFKIEKVKKIVDSKESVALSTCVSEYLKMATVIGYGTNAEVLVAEGTLFSKVVCKKIKKKPLMKCNDIDTELEFQVKINEAGVRTPLALISFEINGEEHFLMERIDGYSIGDILKEGKPLPQKFNYNTFFASLEEQITLMHKAGIYHRDLHKGNVMINEEGLPVSYRFWDCG